ncbi:hypothetical protein M758_UG066000 [Ceratodon purpureus]|nr:hypothetical protein M758_UG066000 [Ceratodon purpureus]
MENDSAIRARRAPAKPKPSQAKPCWSLKRFLCGLAHMPDGAFNSHRVSYSRCSSSLEFPPPEITE